MRSACDMEPVPVPGEFHTGQVCRPVYVSRPQPQGEKCWQKLLGVHLFW